MIAAGLLGSAPTSGQSPGSAPVVPKTIGGATSVISPVVVGQWFANRLNGKEILELLVLWRGTPGWFRQPGGVGDSGGDPGSHHTWLKYGVVDLSLDFDETTRRVTLQGRDRITLGTNNVLLIDEVDGPHGPRIVDTFAIAGTMPGSVGQIAPLLRDSARIMAFLRCDAGKDSPQWARLQTLCLQNVGVER